jgi:hypothetical protein
MGASCLIAIAGTLLYHLRSTEAHGRLPKAVAAALLITGALVGAIPPLWQFLSIRSSLDSVYGQPIRIGWGLWLMVAGFLVVAGTGGWMLDIGGWKDNLANRLDRGLIP